MPDIAFWNKCDNRCVMCTNMRAFARQATAQYRLAGQVGKLERYLKGAAVYTKNSDREDFFSFTGGEPTLHPEFFQLLSYFRRRLPRTRLTLLTNGRRFSDAGFCARFLKIAASPFSVAIPLHGPAPASHDPIAGVKGSFLQTYYGLRNLFAMRAGQDLEIRFVLHALSAPHLAGTLRLLAGNFAGRGHYRLAVIHYEPEGEAARNDVRLGLTLTRSAALVAENAALLGRLPEFRLYHFPLCLLAPRLRRYSMVTQAPEDRVYPEKTCAACRLRAACPGLMADYYRLRGAGELRPLKR